MTAPVTPPAAAAPRAALAPQAMGTGDFLRLLTAQLAQQDPFAPQDGKEMLAQLAQVTATSAAAETAATLKTISTQLATQTRLLEQLAGIKEGNHVVL